jgi:hypothetical protein
MLGQGPTLRDRGKGNTIIMSRFIWQFDLSGEQWSPSGDWQKDSHKWEIRYFWPIEQVIQLNFHESQLNWGNGACKIHHDIYWLDRNNPLNIKQRKDLFVFKEMIIQTNDRIAFEKKETLTGDELPKRNYETIAVDKMALQLIIHQKPKCLLELSKIRVQEQTFSSLCIESRCGELVDDLNSHLNLPLKAKSYVTFLGELLGIVNHEK